MYWGGTCAETKSSGRLAAMSELGVPGGCRLASPLFFCFLGLRDLWYRFANSGIISGASLPLVGRFVGHCRHRTTAGFPHLADEHTWSRQ